MEVILKEDVETLGHRGDVVKVANGYGRNYLLPQRLAIEATAGNKAVIAQMKESANRKAAKDKAAALEHAEKLNAVELTFERKVGANDVLFGSVTSADIAAELAGPTARVSALPAGDARGSRRRQPPRRLHHPRARLPHPVCARALTRLAGRLQRAGCCARSDSRPDATARVR